MSYSEKKLENIELILNKLLDFFARVTIIPCVFILITWVFLITFHVIGRKFFNLQWVFVEEFTGYMMVFIAYFSQPYAYKTSAHIRVALLSEKLPHKIKIYLQLITNFLSIIIVLYLIIRSFQWFYYGYENMMHSSTLHILLWPSYSTIFLGLSILEIEIILDSLLKVIFLLTKKTKKINLH